MNFFTCRAITLSLSFSFARDGVFSWIVRTSGGGNLMGFPSNLRTCKLPMSAKHDGSSSILFFCSAKTLSDVRFTTSFGMDLSLFLLTSRISSDVIRRIWCCQPWCLHECAVEWAGGTNSVGEFAHGIEADIEVAETGTFCEAERKRSQQIV